MPRGRRGRVFGPGSVPFPLMATSAPTVHVEVYSDVVCPWCYIGKARFEKALAELDGEVNVEVVWRPFQLDPSAPNKPSPALEGYAKKFGLERVPQIVATVEEAAKGEGLEIDMSMAQRANTFDAHRLLWWAFETAGSQSQGHVKDGLLRAYFAEGRDTADHETLASIAEHAGLDRGAAAAFLASTAGAPETQAELDEGRNLGITAVPTFVFATIDGEAFGIPGAQEPSTFVAYLRRLAAKASAS